MEVVYEIKDKNGNVIKKFEKKKRPEITIPKFSEETKQQMRDMVKAGVTRLEVGKYYKISQPTLRKIIGNKYFKLKKNESKN